MGDQLNQLADRLAEYYKNAPELPKKFKDGLVQWLPWISLLTGLLTFWYAWTIWGWGHTLTSWINYSTRFYGTEPVIIHPAFGVFAWLAFIFLIAAGVLYLLAFPGLRDRKKAGWDYLFYGVLLYLPYALALLLSPFGDIATIFLIAIGIIVALYVLYQVRNHYSTVRVGNSKPAASSSGKQ